MPLFAHFTEKLALEELFPIKLDHNGLKSDIMSLLHLFCLLRSVIGELANIRISEISSPQ